MEKTEFTTVKSKSDPKMAVREAVNPEEYDKYRKLWDDVSNLKVVTDFPLQIDFELNYSCNFTCPMCTWSAESMENKGRDTWFDFEVYKEVIDNAIPKGLKSVRLNYINEPLIRKDIVKFISYAREAGILDIYFSTNGSLLTDDISRELIKSGLFRLQISLDAYTKETYEKIRTGGNFDDVIKKVLRFLEIRKEMNVSLPTLRVNFVTTEINRNELNEFVKFWENKADSIGIQDLVGIMDGFGKKSEEDLEKMKLEGEFRCAQPFQHLTVRYDGSVLPCCAFYGAETPIGQLKTNKEIKFSGVDNIGLLDKSAKSKLLIGTIESIWKSKQMEFFREIHRKGEFWRHPVCKKCVLSTSHFNL
jgi:MoaA/NifB/PqqE/SkfB family radical SAM enzyme